MTAGQIVREGLKRGVRFRLLEPGKLRAYGNKEAAHELNPLIQERVNDVISVVEEYVFPGGGWLTPDLYAGRVDDGDLGEQLGLFA